MILDEQTNVFMRKAGARWNIEWLSFTHQFKRNSGIAQFHNFNMLELQKAFNQLAIDYDKWLTTLSAQEQDALIKHQHASFLYKTHSFPQLSSATLKKFHLEFKATAHNILMAQYYYIAHHSDLGVHDGILQQLGFQPCQHCCQPQHPYDAVPPLFG